MFLSSISAPLVLICCLTINVLNVYCATDGTSLLSGYLTTHTDVSGQANITLDIRDIHRSLVNGNLEDAKNIYMNGKHSDGRNLARYSLDAYVELIDDPTFLFQVYGLSNGNVAEVTANYAYAHRYVQQALAGDNVGTLASEAIVALNLWMWVAHKVWDGFKDCKEGAIKADVHAFDEAIAYWIGADQRHMKGTGHGLYELATQAEYDFGLREKDSRDLAKANVMITDLYTAAKMYMSYQNTDENTGSCMSPDALQGLYTISHKMISAMRIPLMQKLIHSIQNNHKIRTKLYALAIVPQIAACKPSVHLYLQNKLVEGNYNPTKDRMLVIQLLQQSFDCLGFTCEDIGAYQSSIIPQCADPSGLLPLVMYTPDTHVRKYAKIDLDVLQIKILTELRAMDLAYDIYHLGKNALVDDYTESYLSLHHIATSSNRNKVPRFYQYKSFYNDTNYADVMISMALKGNGRYEKLFNSKMRTESIIDTIVQQAVYMYAMECFWWALEACNDKKKQVSKYDEGVALLIGSIEGPSIGFADVGDGQLLYNIANRNCAQFGVCQETFGVADLSLALMTELNAGKQAIKNFNCSKLEDHVINIADLVLLPLFQSVIKYALIGEAYPANELDPVLAKGEVAALSILPIIDFFNESDAIAVALNMVIEKDIEPVKDGAYAVSEALKGTFHKMNYNCSFMGNTEHVDVCKFEAAHDTVEIAAQSKSGASVTSKFTWFAFSTMLVGSFFLM